MQNINSVGIMASHGFYCCVDACNVHSSDHVPFFRFPKDPLRCQQWKTSLGFVGDHKYANLTSEEAHNRIRICSAHFDVQSFTSSGKRLLSTSVPSNLPSTLDEYNRQDQEIVDNTKIQFRSNLNSGASSQTDSYQNIFETSVVRSNQVVNTVPLPCNASVQIVLRQELLEDASCQTALDLSQSSPRKQQLKRKIDEKRALKSSTSRTEITLQNVLKFLEDHYPQKATTIIKNQLLLLDKTAKGARTMATVEQCETQPSVLASVSDTLKLYDTFKSPQDEEKDSDEESFHLPMMDCDEDLEAKESLTSGPSKVITDETEDDILNKFETNGTPDIDPKMEDSLLLEEIDNLFEKKGSENTNNKDNQSDTNSKDIPIVDKEDNTVSETLESVDDMTVPVEKEISKEIDINKEDENIENINKEDEGIENITEMKENEQTDNITDPEIVIKDVNQETEVDNKSENKDNTADNTHDNKMDVDSQESEITNCKENIESTTTKEDPIPTETEVKENNENDVIESNQHNLNLEELNTLSTDTETKVTTNNHSDTSLEVPSNVQLMETDNIEETKTNVDNTLQEALPQDNNLSDNLDGDIRPETTEKSDKDQKNDNFDENQLHKAITETETTEKFEIDQQNDNSEEKHLKDTVAESVQNEETDPNTQNANAPDKCENSNDSSKSNNLDCDDLLDISIIRDVDEDNASAIAENAKDAQACEKSDNDNEDQDEGSEKAENELDESEMDQDDTLLANDKEDNMDFEDGSSNLCDQENLISENTSDSDSKGNSELRDLEDSSKDVSVSNDMSDVNETELNGEKSSEEETLQMKDTESDTAAEGNQDSNKENLTKTSGKRSLSETDIADSVNKKIKLTVPKDKIHKTSKTKTLISFERYMQNKKLENKLTRSDLEQFCLQKICEAIMHKTDVGELHQTIKKQEQIIETLRKDLQQLTKQTRDLDIVNKKLMNELRTQNGTKKPLVPLKITRSVGLQVKLNTTNDINNRRKVATPTTPRTPTNNNNSTPARARTVAPNAAVVRQVTNATRKPPNAAPLLSQALQTRQATPITTTKRPPIRPKPAEPQKPANASVIDLTDEDDKTSKGAVGSATKTVSKTVSLPNGKAINIIPAKTVANKTMNSNQSKTVAVGQVKTTNSVTKVGTPTRTVAALPQGVRLTPTQVKSGSIAIPAGVVTSNSGTTQLMYVVQPGSVVTSTAGGTQKAVLLNIQPTNGVLAPTLNGSAVSVLPSKTSNTIQLKTVLPTPRKHPAPLPSPPPTMHSSSLKPLLPKPHLSIRKTDTGIILQWRMPYNLELYEAIASYQLFAYQETSAAPSTEMWRKVGDVKALALPMACTLTQFADKNKYYFAVRSIDVHKRIGAFSDPEEISL